jgi:hypothetical protein
VTRAKGVPSGEYQLINPAGSQETGVFVSECGSFIFNTPTAYKKE